nr:uncharacterized protein CI109_002120 [Kwoniella shandongensis]KAA5529694.1 hypothetical protein CI109_002120 [Kwoniella shandongensis]
MAQVHRSEIAVFKMAYSSLATRVVMAAKHLAMLDMMEHSLERETCPNAPVAGPWQTAPRCDQVIQTTMVSLNAKLSSSLLWFPQTHPDGLLASELDKAQRGQADTGVTVHDILDQKRGYVRRADSSNPSSSGPSPIDPLNWLTLNGGSSQGAQVILLSPDSAELGGTATAGKVQ